MHSVSGRDNTPFFTGKKVWLNRCKEVDIPTLEDFWDPENSASHTVSPEVIQQAKVAVYSKKDDDFEEVNLDNLRLNKFLNNKSTVLKLLPPPEDAFIQHVKRAALATLVDKVAHVAKPEVGTVTNYGWSFTDGKLECMKGCNRNGWNGDLQTQDDVSHYRILSLDKTGGLSRLHFAD